MIFSAGDFLIVEFLEFLIAFYIETLILTILTVHYTISFCSTGFEIYFDISVKKNV